MSDTADQVVQTLMKQAYDQFHEGQFEQAAETFSASLAIAPRQAEALQGRGLAYLQLKRWSTAAADFEAARALAPEDPDNWVNLGISLAMDNQIYPAIKVFETLLVRQPKCARGHLELGLLHLRLGAIPKGRQQLQQVLACRPTLAERRLIESVLHEQDQLDRKRYYRPDFDALHRQQAGWPFGGFAKRVQQVMKSFSDAMRVRKGSARRDPH